jgi:hypothetical protein
MELNLMLKLAYRKKAPHVHGRHADELLASAQRWAQVRALEPPARPTAWRITSPSTERGGR